MNKIKNMWFEFKAGKQVLRRDGYPYFNTRTEIYESNIPPILRFFHIHDISPSGWIGFQAKNAKKANGSMKMTTCKYEYEIASTDIVPLNNKEAIVPYKICSFDIEASSSHGDFPLAIKSYKKLATNIVDIYNNLKKNNIEITKEILYRIICTAFEYDNYDDVDIVYTKKKLLFEEVNDLFKKWFEKNIDDMEEKDEEIAYVNTIENMFENMINKNKDRYLYCL